MSKYLASLAALTLVGTAAIALPADAAGRRLGATAFHQGHVNARQFGARRYAAPRYGYRNYGYRNTYGYSGYSDGYPYGYGAPPLVSFGVGPFGLRLF